MKYACWTALAAVALLGSTAELARAAGHGHRHGGSHHQRHAPAKARFHRKAAPPSARRHQQARLDHRRHHPPQPRRVSNARPGLADHRRHHPSRPTPLRKVRRDRDYFCDHAVRCHGGYCYRGRHHCHWSERIWSARHRCYLYLDAGLCRYFYWCAPAGCYYQVDYCPYGRYDFPDADEDDSPQDGDDGDSFADADDGDSPPDADDGDSPPDADDGDSPPDDGLGGDLA